jgi:GNAT superfamily N-acetyltransferase
VFALGKITPEYREANVDDLETIVQMWDTSRKFHEELDSRLAMIDDASSKVGDHYKEQLASENSLFYLAFVDSQAAGYAGFLLHKTPPIHIESQVGFIDSLFVYEDYRKHGIGSHLVNLGIEWFKKQEINIVQLSVASKNPIGIEFWEKCGFTDIMKRMRQSI